MAARLGDLERRVLLAVLRLGEEAYAVGVRNELERRTGRPVTRGAIYTTLDRLQRKGYLTSRMSAPRPERGGKARRVFRMEPAGREVLRTALDEMASLVRELDDDLAGEPT